MRSTTIRAAAAVVAMATSTRVKQRQIYLFDEGSLTMRMVARKGSYFDAHHDRSNFLGGKFFMLWAGFKKRKRKEKGKNEKEKGKTKKKKEGEKEGKKGRIFYSQYKTLTVSYFLRISVLHCHSEAC